MRVFVAVEVSNKDLLNSIRKFQTYIKINAKPVELQNIHFTLLFLGEVSDIIVNEVQRALDSIEFSTFNVKLVGAGAF